MSFCEKGVFDRALRSLDELDLAVRKRKQRIQQLEKEIIKDVLYVAREGKLEKEIDSINEQLEREKKVFDELMYLIERTLAEYHKNSIKNEEIIEKIMKLRKKLSDVSCMHESLLSDKIRVQNLMSKALENMIVNAFSTSVNFEKEVDKVCLEKVML